MPRITRRSSTRAFPRALVGQMRFNLRKLRIRQPVPILNDLGFISEALNHKSPTAPRLLWVWKKARAWRKASVRV
jgi:hypothetical protein